MTTPSPDQQHASSSDKWTPENHAACHQGCHERGCRDPAPSTGATAGEGVDFTARAAYLDRELTKSLGDHEATLKRESALRTEVAQLRSDLAEMKLNYEWSITRGKVWVAKIERLRSDLAHAQAERDNWKAAPQEEITRRHTVLEPRIQALRAQVAERDSHSATLQAKIVELIAVLRDELAGHEAYVDNTPCDAGNFDGGNERDCEHCQHERRLSVISAALAQAQPQQQEVPD